MHPWLMSLDLRKRLRHNQLYLPLHLVSYVVRSFNLKHQKRVKILFDTGCGATLIHHSLDGKLPLQMDRLSNWSTKAGNFRTTKTCKINFVLPAFHEGRNISW